MMMNQTKTPDWIDPALPGFPDAQITYHDDGVTIKRVDYVGEDRKFKRLDGPASIAWHKNGIRAMETWFPKSRTDGPAMVLWHENGQKQSEGWYIDHDLDREDGPAYTQWDTDGNIVAQNWYKDGKKIW